MSYTLTHYNGSQFAVVSDGTITTNLVDITLIGKDYTGYGPIQNENFLYLLENFAKSTAPSYPTMGQLWYDSTTLVKKIKLRDDTGWKTLAVANVGATPTGGIVPASHPTIGDMWYDTTNNQLKIYNGTDYTLIGPQSLSGFGKTQIQSLSVDGHGIQQAFANGNLVFTISSDSSFTPSSSITGFSTIYQGITLNSNYKLYGTATNADKLGNVVASGYVLSSNPTFTSQVNTPDAGVKIGSTGSLFNNNGIITLQNGTSNTLAFQTYYSGNTSTALKIISGDTLPGQPTSNLGTSLNPWYSVWATSFNGLASKSSSLLTDGNQYLSATTSTSPGSILARNGHGDAFANNFRGNLVGNVTGNVTGNADTATHATTATIASSAQLVDWTSINGTPTNFVYNDNNVNTWHINIQGSVNGNATSATSASKLTRSVNINGVPFDGSSNVNVISAGTGININGSQITNTGVLSINGKTGNVTGIIPTGLISMWYGTDPTGIPNGWAQCDGANGTPDLTSLFVSFPSHTLYYIYKL